MFLAIKELLACEYISTAIRGIDKLSKIDNEFNMQLFRVKRCELTSLRFPYVSKTQDLIYIIGMDKLSKIDNEF